MVGRGGTDVIIPNILNHILIPGFRPTLGNMIFLQL